MQTSMGHGFSAGSGVLPFQYDFINAHYSYTSAALVYNVVKENTLVAVTHHNVVDQVVVINIWFTLITIDLTQKLNVTFLID